MAYELRITFAGLCLFRQRGNQRMDVLLPVAEHGHGHSHAHLAPHFPRAFYAVDHEGHSSPPSGPDIVKSKKTGKLHRRIELKKKWLDLDVQPKSGSNDPLSEELFVNIFHHIARQEVSAKPGEVPGLAACVTLPPGNADVPDARGGWTLVWPGGSQPPAGARTHWPKLGWKVVWTAHAPDPDPLNYNNVLQWGLKELDGKHSKNLNRLIAQGGRIEMLISNLPNEESEPDEPDVGHPPPPSSEAEHFQAFKVFYPGLEAWPRLVYDYQPSIEIRPVRPEITAYSCVPGKGQ